MRGEMVRVEVELVEVRPQIRLQGKALLADWTVQNSPCLATRLTIFGLTHHFTCEGMGPAHW